MKRCWGVERDHSPNASPAAATAAAASAGEPIAYSPTQSPMSEGLMFRYAAPAPVHSPDMKCCFIGVDVQLTDVRAQSAGSWGRVRIASVMMALMRSRSSPWIISRGGLSVSVPSPVIASASLM